VLLLCHVSRVWPPLQCLVKWWAEYPGPLLQERVVVPLQQYLTDELFVTKKLTVSVMNVIKVLAKVEEANQLGRQLPPEAFYNELIRLDPNCLFDQLTDVNIFWTTRLEMRHLTFVLSLASMQTFRYAACMTPARTFELRLP